ncbi:YhfT family protein [Streptomyces sp. CT34]|uniref:YhfT family protein n=1 Tax=Streptomyces sp. CT34 TaxID=1553907 RepID=UPI00069058F7|nr:YhfT family protein [Streptomyces sp. CT34]
MRAPYTAAPGLGLSPAQQLAVIGLCALTALLSHLALAVFNDGVRPFLLDFVQGRSTRGATGAVSFGLSAGFVFGLGAPMALSSGVLNPWLVFLPTDVLGILAPRKWLAPLLGGAWGALVVLGLKGVNGAAHQLPVDFLTAMRHMATPILYLFTLFPVLAVSKQFGRLHGAVAGVLELSLVVVTLRVWPGVFAGAPAMAAGVLLLVGMAVVRDLRAARAVGSVRAMPQGGGDTGGADPMASLFGASAARLRRHLPLFMALGAGVCLLAQLRILGGGEAAGFLLAKGRAAEAAQVDFYRALGFLPLVATTALASGAYGIAGFTLVFPVGYLLPDPWLALGCGALLFAVEVLALSGIGRALGRLPSVRDSSEQLRGAIGDTLQLAVLFGSLLAAQAMGGGLGILLVGGLYLLNEAMGRVVVRMAAGPAAVLVGGVLLNVLYWLDLFTPVQS